MNRGNIEYVDVLDCTGRKTGHRITRDQAHHSGTWHGAFHCLIIYERRGIGCAVFQKRSVSKKIAAGRFDVSVGGHYGSGEDAHDAGPREIREEIGLPVEFEELVGLGRRVFVHCFTPGVTEYEFQDVFLLPRGIQPGEIRLQAEEVDGLLEMEVASGIRLFSGEIKSATGSLLTSDGKFIPHAITADAFVPAWIIITSNCSCLQRDILRASGFSLFDSRDIDINHRGTEIRIQKKVSRNALHSCRALITLGTRDAKSQRKAKYFSVRFKKNRNQKHLAQSRQDAKKISCLTRFKNDHCLRPESFYSCFHLCLRASVVK